MLALRVLPEACEFLEWSEINLNRLGYVPVVGTVAAVLRAAILKAEVIAFPFLCVGAIVMGIGGYSGASLVAIAAVKLFIHAVLNLCRTCCEFFPGAALFTCLPYDFLIGSLIPGARLFSYVI